MHLGRVALNVVFGLLLPRDGLGLQLRACVPSPLGDCPDSGLRVHRRNLLSGIGAGIMISGTAPEPAIALDLKLPANSRGATELLLESWENQPVKSGRSRINQDFAVLLMRSSYNTVDQLDFVPMNVFQREFFLFRQSTYTAYLTALNNAFVAQGELSDPRYFDFISFAQYATIGACMKKGVYVFTETVGADGEEILVRRDTAITNAMLPALHSHAVGEAILNWFLERYNIEGRKPTLPVIAHQTTESLIANMKQLLGLFFLNDFMADFDVSSLGQRNNRQEVELRMSGSASRWSLQALERRGSPIRNDFEVKAVLAYLDACRVDDARWVATKFKGNDVVHKIDFKAE